MTTTLTPYLIPAGCAFVGLLLAALVLVSVYAAIRVPKDRRFILLLDGLLIIGGICFAVGAWMMPVLLLPTAGGGCVFLAIRLHQGQQRRNFETRRRGG
jgi:uncharacterized membrane protein